MTSPLPTSGTKKSRLSLDLDEKARAHLDGLCEASGASTYAELIKRALALYELVQNHKADGGSMVFRHSDGSEERLVIL
jgi:hypothetical protein